MIPTQQAPMRLSGLSQPQMPQMQNQQNGQKSGGGKFDPLRAMLEGPAQIIGQMLSQDLMQAKQMGVPTDNLIQTLLSMSPISMGAKAGQEAGAALMGGGGSPPGGPQPPNGGGPPPNGPGGVATDDQSNQMAPQSTGGQNINQAFLGGNQATQPGAMGAQPGFNPMATLAGIPTAQELQPRFNQVRNGGMFSINKMLPNGDIQAGGPFAAMFGPTMNQITGAQGAISAQGANQAQEKAVGAAITPQSASEKATNEASLAKNQMDMWNKSYEKLLEPVAGAKELSQVEGAITALDDITNILGISVDKTGTAKIKNRKLLGDPVWVRKNRPGLLRARDLFINKTLRRDSGATITPADEKAAARSIGFNVGASAFLQNPDLIAKSIVSSREQLLRDRTNLSPNSTTRLFVQEAKAQGATDAQIKQYLAQKGDLG